MCLRGSAQKILSELTYHQCTNYITLTQVLNQRFNPQEGEIVARCEFRNRKREIGETVAQCGYSLKRLAQRAFPNEPNSSLEIHVIDQYLNGLGNYELKKHLTFKHPQTLQQAISCASEYEAIEGPLDKIRVPTFCPVSESGDKVLAVKQKSKKVEEKEDLESILSRLLDEKLEKLSTEKLESERHKSKFSQPQTSTQFKSFIRERERMNREPTLLETLCVIIAEEWVIDRVGVTSNKEMRAIENLQRPLKKLAPFLKMISRKTS